MALSWGDVHEGARCCRRARLPAASLAALQALILAAGLAGCRTPVSSLSPGDAVDETFRRLHVGKLSPNPECDDGPCAQDGWQTRFPNGSPVMRSVLIYEGERLARLGPQAVPTLLRWVDHRNTALRYVAGFALARITGIKGRYNHFDDDDRHGQRAVAIAAWRDWLRRNQAAGARAR